MVEKLTDENRRVAEIVVMRGRLDVREEA